MNQELPLGWVECELGDVAQVIGGGTPDSQNPDNFSTTSGIAWLTPADLSDHEGIYISHGKRFLTKKGYSSSSARLMPKGTVLFSSRAPIGYVAVAANDISTNQGFKSFVSSDGILSEFVYFWLRYATPIAESMASGTTFAEISGKNAARIPLLLPPFAEQKRIAAKLEVLLGKVDACRKRLEKIPVILRRFRQSVLAAACSGRLTADWRKQKSEWYGQESDDELPEGWKAACVGDAVESLKYGTSQKCGYEELGVPVLRIPNVANGTIDHADLKYADLPLKERNQLQVSPGDILLIRSNGSVSLVGKSALVRETERGFAYAGYLIRLRPNRDVIEPEFLNMTLSGFDIRLQIELDARSTSGVNNINSGEVRALHFNLPPLPEQHEIVRRVDALFALADQIETRYAKAKTHVDRLTQSILAKAFRGVLVPQDPNDEPASVLLERIRSQRQAVGVIRNQPRRKGVTAASKAGIR